MRLAVEGGGYSSAAGEFESANQFLGFACESLSGKLTGYAGMAGDDATSYEFAQAYDSAAAQGLSTLGDVVAALGSFSTLLEASGSNHVAAETANAGRPDPPRPLARDLMVFRPTTLPAAAGGTPHSPDNVKGWIVDQIQGFVWPSADIDLLREAAHTWKYAATALDELPSYSHTATVHLEDQHSPEIPLALDALYEFVGLVGECPDRSAQHVPGLPGLRRPGPSRP